MKLTVGELIEQLQSRKADTPVLIYEAAAEGKLVETLFLEDSDSGLVLDGYALHKDKMGGTVAEDDPFLSKQARGTIKRLAEEGFTISIEAKPVGNGLFGWLVTATLAGEAKGSSVSLSEAIQDVATIIEAGRPENAEELPF